MTERPRLIRVGCLTYRVETDVAAINAASDDADLEPGAEWSAFSDHDRLLIAINGDNPTDVQRRDVLHEVLHCCLRYAGAEPNAYARIVGRAKERHGGFTVEEFMVAAASGPLLSVLRDNPGLSGWLTDTAESQMRVMFQRTAEAR